MSISLNKGERISLSKTAPAGLRKIFMGLGWDPVKEKAGWFGKATEKKIDLDASVILFGEENQVIDIVSFRNLSSRDGSIQHGGDNLTGDGDGDDERIYLDLERVPAAVKALVFVVTSFSGQRFKDIESATCRLVDENSKQELAKIVLSEKGDFTAAIMSSVYRKDGEWKMQGVNDPCNGRVAQDVVSNALRHV
jgi:tellurium resistance protein TerZ